MQRGLIQLNSMMPWSSDTSEEMPTPHIFSAENGDDWFYFEDMSSMSLYNDTNPHPFSMRTVSGSGTEILRLMYNGQPKHKMVHKGACSFTGIKTPDEKKSSWGQSPFTVQVNVEKSI